MSIKVYKLKLILLLGFFAVTLFACNKEQHFDNPYAGGKEPLGIRLSTDKPSPEKGEIGSSVIYKGKGLVSYKSALKFFINGERAEVLNVDTNGIEVKVPETASTGVASLTVGDQIFFGPIFRVVGNLTIDSSFKAVVGADNDVNDYLILSGGQIILVGSFSDFNHEGSGDPLNRIVMITKDGEVVRSLNNGKGKTQGADGTLKAIAALPNGKMVIAGAFSSYVTHRGEIRNISLLNEDGSLDTMVVRTFLKKDTVPTFNGGVDGTIRDIFVHNGTITAVGSFNYYLQNVYGQSDYLHQRDSLILDSVRMRNIVRFFPDGSLDSSFNYNYRMHRGRQGPNGPITDAYMQEDGKLIVVGRFTQYNGETVNNIVRLDKYGNIDRSFRVGSGADRAISSISYNDTTGHFLLSGGFEHFNGQPQSGLALLNKDGSLVESFNPIKMGNNAIYLFAKQLSNKLIIVNGFFREYNGIHRGGFMVLDPATGKLAPGYNTMGNFHGIISKAIESKNGTGQTIVTLMGGFGEFDEQTMGNITRLIFYEEN